MAEAVCDIAVVGLAVMGQNLILNMNDHGFVVGAYNRTVVKVDEFLANEAKGTKIVGIRSLEEIKTKLKTPRKVMLMIKAGKPVDDMIDSLLPHLEKGDIIIDGGNSHFSDTQRRVKRLAELGFHFIGAGVSGGEEGARYGPSIMPGGSMEAWLQVKPIFQSISAKVGNDPCCDYVGEDGAGHYVKMVHNGIEYGDIQLICEAYHLLKDAVGLNHQEMSEVFAQWNKEELDSFLIEITSKALAYKTEEGKHLVELIRDTAGQKGTGKWSAISALDLGVPVTLIGEAVYARCLSAMKDERVKASGLIKGPAARVPLPNDKAAFINDIKYALYASKIVSYAQGFMLLREAAINEKWHLNYGGIALMWRGGCIIKSQFLGKIKEAYDNDPNLQNLLLDKFFKEAIEAAQISWRRVVAHGVMSGIPTPAFSTALSFFDGYRTANLPANLLQALRDYFGAHTYELANSPGVFHHTNWTGTGGNVSSSTYNTQQTRKPAWKHAPSVSRELLS